MTLQDILRKYGLSKAESYVIANFVKGGTNQEVADRIFLSRHSVRYQCWTAYPKLGVKTKSQCILKVAEIEKAAREQEQK